MSTLDEQVQYLLRTMTPFEVGITVAGAPASPPNVTAQRRKQVAQVRVEAGNARSWRVTLDEPAVVAGGEVNWGTGFTGPDRMLRARVLWGTEGVAHEAVVDWGRGCSFDVHGDNVSVIAEVPIDAQAIAVVPATDLLGPRVRLGASVVPSEGSRSTPPTCSVFSNAIGPQLFSLPLPIPAYARRVRWSQLQNTGAPVNGIQPPRAEMVLAQTQDIAGLVPCATEPFLTQAGQPVGGFGSGGWPGGGYWVVHPSARFMFVGNAAPLLGAVIAITLEYELDLG